MRFSQIIEVWFIIWGSKFVMRMIDNSTSESRMKGKVIANEFMGKFCVFSRNQKCVYKYFNDRGINELDLGRMVGKCCLSYIFSWYIEIFNQGIDKLGI